MAAPPWKAMVPAGWLLPQAASKATMGNAQSDVRMDVFLGGFGFTVSA
jgi:hypothetical protein